MRGYDIVSKAGLQSKASKMCGDGTFIVQ